MIQLITVLADRIARRRLHTTSIVSSAADKNIIPWICAPRTCPSDPGILLWRLVQSRRRPGSPAIGAHIHAPHQTVAGPGEPANGMARCGERALIRRPSDRRFDRERGEPTPLPVADPSIHFVHSTRQKIGRFILRAEDDHASKPVVRKKEATLSGLLHQ